MLQSKRSINEGPGRDWRLLPGPRCAAPVNRRMGKLFMPCRPGAVQCWGDRVGSAGRADLPALQLRALRRAGAHLPALRSRANLLRRGVCAYPPARVAAACRGAIPAKPPRRASTCRAPAALAALPTTRSDASGMLRGRALRQRSGSSNVADGTERCRSHSSPALRVLPLAAATVDAAGALVLERMSLPVLPERSDDDLA